MRVGPALLAALMAVTALEGCLLPEPGDLDFVPLPVATGGEAWDTYRFGGTLSSEGYSDCTVFYAVVPVYSDPRAGCVECDVTFVIDLQVTDDQCPQLPPGLDGDILGLSVGFDDRYAWFYSAADSTWLQWLQGENEGQRFVAQSPWWPQEVSPGRDYELQQNLEVEWREDD